MKRFFKRVWKAITHPKLTLIYILSSPIFRFLDDKTYLKAKYCLSLGDKLNLENPTKYTEKLQWLKLYDRRPEYTTMVDKYAVKEYVANIIGEEYIIPTLGVWDSFDDIDFDALPDKFVLKTTHDSGTIVICRDKSTFDKEAAKKKINKRLNYNYFYIHREWPYKDVRPRIIAEPYLEDTKYEELRDYKYYCYDGICKLMFIVTNRQNKNSPTYMNYFDMDFNHIPIKNGGALSEILPEKPINFVKMRELAEKLSQNIPHVRIDFYEVDGKVYFGEMTFFDSSGFEPFDPPEWNEIWGSWIKLPDKT